MFKGVKGIKIKNNSKTIMNNNNNGETNNTNEECVMCCQKIYKDKDKLIPSECLMKYGKFKAHKICSECWWSKFAPEGVSHKCPGCESGKPFGYTFF